MTISEKELTTKLNSMRLSVTQEQFNEMLALFGTESDECHEWTEQDICEQIRKIVR